MPEISDIRTASFSHFGHGSVLNGDYKLKGEIQIHCELQGNIRTVDEDTHITLGPTAKVTATIICHNIEIYGRFRGKIDSKGRVAIHASALVEGDISCERLVVYPGAIVDMDGQTLS